eukprot:g31867.t1
MGRLSSHMDLSLCKAEFFQLNNYNQYLCDFCFFCYSSVRRTDQDQSLCKGGSLSNCCSSSSSTPWCPMDADYIPWGQEEVTPVSSRRLYAPAAAGLLVLASWVGGVRRLLLPSSPLPDSTLHALPDSTRDALPTRPGSPGPAQMFAQIFRRPRCVFLYEDQNVDGCDKQHGATEDRARVSGARLSRQRPADVLEGRLLCWATPELLAPCLQAADLRLIYEGGVRRGSTTAQTADGARNHTCWWYLQQSESSAWRRRGVYKNRTDMPPLSVIADKAGVAAPWSSPKWVWSRAWKAGKHALPLLHRWDECHATDTNVNLIVLWLKALAGNRRQTRDDGLAYDLLPPWTRAVVAPAVAWLYPLLHHQNIALRTAYLDQLVTAELAAPAGPAKPTYVVLLGAGFDVRALRLMGAAPATGVVWTEVDLPHVVAQKRCLLSRLRGRRPELDSSLDQLIFVPANLSCEWQVLESTLHSVLASMPKGARAIFVLEALMIYLPSDKAAALLQTCVDVSAKAGVSSVAVAFADELPNMEGYNASEASKVLARAGLVLDQQSWLPKPGLACHMGIARWKQLERPPASHAPPAPTAPPEPPQELPDVPQ